MTFYALSALINAITTALLGTFVYCKDRTKPVNRNFALFYLCLSAWSYAYFIWQISTVESTALFWCRVLMVGAIFIPVTSVHFTASLLNKYKENKKVLVFGYIFATVSFLFNFTPLFVKSVSPKLSFKFWPDAGPTYGIFLVYFASYAIYAAYLMFKALPVLPGYRRNQVKYVLIGSIVGYLGGATNYPLWYDIKLIPFGNIFIAVGTAIIAYGIAKHRLLDINIVITRGIAYASIVFLIAGAYLGMVFGLDSYFSALPGYNPALAHSLLFLVLLWVLIFILPEMRTKAIDMVRDRIFRGKYDYQKELMEASKEISSILNPEDLSRHVVERLRDVFQACKIAMLILDEASQEYRVMAEEGLDKEADILRFSAKSHLAQLLKTADSILVDEEISEPTLKKKLSALETELIVPLMVKDTLVGMVLLGIKRGGHMYTQEDISLLSPLAGQLALTLEYICTIDKVSDEKRYVGLGKASMRMAHDIKNPLVPIKTFLQLLPEKYPAEYKKMGEIDSEFTGHFYESALNGVERIDLLIQRALHYARHPEPIFSKVSLHRIIDDALTQEEIDIRDNKVNLVKDYFSTDATIEADADQLMELFSNLVSNSVDAMQESKTRNLTISTKSKNHDVVITVADSGCGIPKNRLSAIFDPFITYKHQGSGLGLAIVRKIAEDHKGKAEISSEENKGTTVTITLPKTAKKIE